MRKKNICVFCGASSGSTSDYRILAEEIGKIIGENNFNLIYGAGSTGLMGACAKSAKNSGSKVYGVMPNFLARIEKPLDDISIKYTSTMRTRKAIMYKQASLFIILPGGIGTLDECIEVLTLIQLKQIKQKKIIIFNYKDYWNFLLQLLENMKKEKFMNDNFYSDLIELKDLNKLKTLLKSF
tara:strand:- start:122 stop:667 length:546 start_codon:yes stop_codon:yes gene_type:complete